MNCVVVQALITAEIHTGRVRLNISQFSKILDHCLECEDCRKVINSFGVADESERENYPDFTDIDHDG